MEFNSQYVIEIARIESAGSLRRDEPLKLWLSQVRQPGAPGLTERFTGDTAYDVARRAAEYIVELEAR